MAESFLPHAFDKSKNVGLPLSDFGYVPPHNIKIKIEFEDPEEGVVMSKVELPNGGHATFFHPKSELVWKHNTRSPF